MAQATSAFKHRTIVTQLMLASQADIAPSTPFLPRRVVVVKLTGKEAYSSAARQPPPASFLDHLQQKFHGIDADCQAQHCGELVSIAGVA